MLEVKMIRTQQVNDDISLELRLPLCARNNKGGYVEVKTQLVY
jgi:hypothetical protein